jgi:hypothetical protein
MKRFFLWTGFLLLFFANPGFAANPFAEDAQIQGSLTQEPGQILNGASPTVTDWVKQLNTGDLFPFQIFSKILTAPTIEKGKSLTRPIQSLKNVQTTGLLFYSNIFESVIQPGILFSTLSKDGKADPQAHLGYSVRPDGNRPRLFDFFGHHRLGTSEIQNGKKVRHSFSGEVVVLLFNPSSKQITSGFISQNVTSSMKERSYAAPYGGPGDLSACRILGRKNTQSAGPFTLQPRQFKVINRWTGGFCETHNTQIHGGVTSGEIQLVEVAVPKSVSLSGMSDEAIGAYLGGLRLHCFSPTDHPYVPSGRVVSVVDLNGKSMAVEIPKFMGRAGGVSDQGAITATIPEFNLAGDADVAFALNTTPNKLFGQNQHQSVRFIKYYHHRAVDAKTGLAGTVSSPFNFGNYGVRQTFIVPLVNKGKTSRRVLLGLGCPTWNEGNSAFPTFSRVSEKERTKIGLPGYYLRTEVLTGWFDRSGEPVGCRVRVNQTAGEISELIRFSLNPGERKTVIIQLLGTGDSTPNHVLSIIKCQ